MKYPLPAAAAVLLAATPALAQNISNTYDTPIQRGSLTVGIVDFATLPTSGGPARASVMTSDPAGRLFVNDQRGPLYTVSPDGQSVGEYLDLRDFPGAGGVNLRVQGGEQGFQSFAFHPDFNTPDTAGFGKFYTLQSSNFASDFDFNPGTGGGGSLNFSTTLLEWTAADPAAGAFAPAVAGQPFRELARFAQPFGNHNGGLIAFNTSPVNPADRGNLYVALGDGGSGGDPQDNGQDASNPYGAILRIDPLGSNSANGQYGIVAANAFAADTPTANTLGEIYSFGFRNPQRFGWDDVTGNLFVADIGQGQMEELSLAVNGGNFGWNDREGSIRFDSDKDVTDIDPFAEYDHSAPFQGRLVTTNNNGNTSFAVTVGEVARGTSIPGLDGKLLAGDFPNGILLYYDVDNNSLAPDGGQDDLLELNTVDQGGNSVRLIDLIQAQRAADGLGNAGRADLRYSIGTGGRIFVTNKQDGVIRELVAIPEPASIALIGVGGLYLLRRRQRP